MRCPSGKQSERAYIICAMLVQLCSQHKQTHQVLAQLSQACLNAWCHSCQVGMPVVLCVYIHTSYIHLLLSIYLHCAGFHLLKKMSLIYLLLHLLSIGQEAFQVSKLLQQLWCCLDANALHTGDVFSCIPTECQHIRPLQPKTQHSEKDTHRMVLQEYQCPNVRAGVSGLFDTY